MARVELIKSRNLMMLIDQKDVMLNSNCFHCHLEDLIIDPLFGYFLA